MIKPNDRIDLECAKIHGTIELDMSEFLDESVEATFLYYTCGDASSLKVMAQGKVCTVTGSSSSTGGKQAYLAVVSCPDNSLAQGTNIRDDFYDTLTF